MLQRLAALSQKEFIQIRRDKRTLTMMIFLPLLWLVLFGYAFSFDVDVVTVAIADQSGTAMGELVARTLAEYSRFQPISLTDPTETGIRAAIHRDQAVMGIVIPPGFGQAPTQLTVIIDGSQLFAAQTGAQLLPKALAPLQARLPGGSPAQLIPATEVLYNPELKSAHIMIPGLLGMVVMFMATVMTAMGVVREREHGTLEQLVVTPIRPIELMLGKLFPYFLIASLDFALVFLAGTHLFGLRFAGNLPLFLALSLLLLLMTLGLGLLISTAAQNQQQAMQLALMAIMPQMVVSGLIFPLSSMPVAIQWVARVLPFTYYVPIARGMFIKGQGLDLLTTPALMMLLYAVATVTLATVRFRKRLG